MNDEPGSSRIRIEIVTLDPHWPESLAGCARIARRAAAAALDLAAADLLPAGTAELSLVLAGDDQVRALNRDYRGQDKPTNVLSFPNMEAPGESPWADAGGDRRGPSLLGDIVVARETLLREAQAQQKHAQDHLSHLVVHGVLHLLGYNHADDGEADEMEGCEIRILQSLGIADPYRSAPASAPGVEG